jgi:hypothetical protein
MSSKQQPHLAGLESKIRPRLIKKVTIKLIKGVKIGHLGFSAAF